MYYICLFPCISVLMAGNEAQPRKVIKALPATTTKTVATTTKDYNNKGSNNMSYNNTNNNDSYNNHSNNYKLKANRPCKKFTDAAVATDTQ